MEPKVRNGVFGALEYVFFLFCGAGIINLIKIFGKNEVVLVSVNEKCRRDGLFKLLYG